MMTMTRIATVCVAALLAWAVPAACGQGAAPPYTDVRELPDTPAYAAAKEIVALVNSADAAKAKSFIESRFTDKLRSSFPMEEHLAEFRRWHEFAGALEVYGARTYDPPRPATAAVLICRAGLAESWRAVVVEVEDAAPHRIASLQFSPARTPTGLPAAPALSAEQIGEQLGAYVDRLAKANAFSGTMLFAKDGGVLATRAVGIANRDFNAPVTIDTAFNLGSMNKMMTAVAVMQLVEAGKLSLDDPISKHLSDDWLPKVDKSKVTVKHLLTHSSGLGSYFNDTFFNSSRALYRKVNDYKALVKDEELAFTPGSESRYSNTGMLIAGAVIERASGQDYFDYIAEHVTGPAGMTRSGFFELDHVNPNLAVGYEKQSTAAGVEYTNNLYTHVIRGGPAGGGYSTVTDLLRFDQALRAQKLVGKSSLEQLWSPHPEVGNPQYGLGFGVARGPAGREVGHGGGFEGISANLGMYLDAGYTVCVLSNYGGAAELVATKARELISQGH